MKWNLELVRSLHWVTQLRNRVVVSCRDIDRARWCHQVQERDLWSWQPSKSALGSLSCADFSALRLCCLLQPPMSSGITAHPKALPDGCLRNSSPLSCSILGFQSSSLGVWLSLEHWGKELGLVWSHTALLVSSLPSQEPHLLKLCPFLFPRGLVACGDECLSFQSHLGESKKEEVTCNSQQDKLNYLITPSGLKLCETTWK